MNSELLLAFVMRRLGGRGSGNFGHAGRPGAVGGSGSGGSYYGKKGQGIDASTERGVSAARQAFIKAEFAKQGFPDYRVRIVKGGRKFIVGNDIYTSGGRYDPRTGQITISTQEAVKASERELAGLIAHEVSHARFEQSTTHNWADDSIEFVKQIETNKAELSAKDGVTEYSESYWKSVSQAQNMFTSEKGTEKVRMRAINETLAEIAKKLREYPQDRDRIPKVWIDLFDALHKVKVYL